MLSLGYWIIDLPFWLLIGLVGGVLNIVPFLGPWVGGILGVVVALTTTDLTTAFWAAVVAIIVQQIDNNFVSPSVLRATVRLHPAVTLLVLVLAGAIAGFWGIVIAVPLTAALKIVVGYWWRTRILEQSPHEAAEAMFIEPPKRKSWTREMDAITVPGKPATAPPPRGFRAQGTSGTSGRRWSKRRDRIGHDNGRRVADARPPRRRDAATMIDVLIGTLVVLLIVRGWMRGFFARRSMSGCSFLVRLWRSGSHRSPGVC